MAINRFGAAANVMPCSTSSVALTPLWDRQVLPTVIFLILICIPQVLHFVVQEYLQVFLAPRCKIRDLQAQ